MGILSVPRHNVMHSLDFSSLGECDINEILREFVEFF